MPGDELSVDVAVEFVVDVVVANVLQRSSTGRAFEALDVEILLLYSDEDANDRAVTVAADDDTVGTRCVPSRLLLLLLLLLDRLLDGSCGVHRWLGDTELGAEGCR